MHTQNVTMENFESVVDTQPMVLLDFWAEWCAPCKIFSPIFEQLAELNPDIYFGKVNTEEALDLAQAFQVKSVPTLMAFKNGELIYEASGIPSPAQIQALLVNLRESQAEMST